MRDMLMYGMTETEHYADLASWFSSTPKIHKFVPDYHRLQIERWVWDRREVLGKKVMDVGVDNARRWIGPGYFTLGLKDCDVSGNLLNLPIADRTLDGILLTEVLEHCEDPFRAVDEAYRVLKPAGMLFVTSPFFWPDHRTPDYPDFWRFTDQGWQLLLRKFETVKITPFQWTDEGAQAYDMMRRFECMGMRRFTQATTGYRCEAIK